MLSAFHSVLAAALVACTTLVGYSPATQSGRRVGWRSKFMESAAVWPVQVVGCSQKATLSLAGRVVSRLVACVGLTSAAPDQGLIGAFLLGRFAKVLRSQGVGRSTPLAGKLCVQRLKLNGVNTESIK